MCGDDVAPFKTSTYLYRQLQNCPQHRKPTSFPHISKPFLILWETARYCHFPSPFLRQNPKSKMAGAQEEVTAPESSVTGPDGAVEQQTSNEATILTLAHAGTVDSTCNNNGEDNGETSAPSDEKPLELAAELTEKGIQALKESDYAEAVECFSRALEIRVSHYGELAVECMRAYYQYGRALLYKAQEEADPLGTVPKKESTADKDGSVKSVKTADTSAARVSISNNGEEVGSSSNQVQAADNGGKNGEEEGEDGETSEDEDLADGDEDEDESDLDLAWKMLDVARAIAEKQADDTTIDKVDILSVLAEVSLEREDMETSLSDYQKAISILERIVEPDSRRLAELNFRVCLCLEIGSMPQEAIPYCQKAISVCNSRLQRLMSEVKSSSQSATSSAVSELDESVQQSSNVTHPDESLTEKEGEIETLTGLSGELEKKLEDLQQQILNPKSILQEILGIASAKARGGQTSGSAAIMSSSQLATATSSEGFDSPTVSTAHTNGAGAVTNLGIVGRGVKRMLTSSGSVGSAPSKKPTLDSSSEKKDGNNS